MTASLIFCAQAFGGIVYSNDFESPFTAYNGLTPGGTISALGLVSLPTDGGGIGGANESTWLGQIGAGVGKQPGTSETVTLSLNGLNPGSVYTLAFDLLIGASWDGSNGCCGPDDWAVTASSGSSAVNLVDATFSNCGVANNLCGGSVGQTYSDATPTAGSTGSLFAPTTGSDFSSDTNGDYSQDYAIYYFSHGAGNPTLSFTAGDTTATVLFERKSGSYDSSDEYWALDNILVTSPDASTGTPEPASILLIATGIAGLALRRPWKRC